MPNRKGVLPSGSHERHSSPPGPEHVAHVELHASHVLEVVFAHLPTEVHSARQLPGELKKGDADAHEVHSISDGPEHVAHGVAHGRGLGTSRGIRGHAQEFQELRINLGESLGGSRIYQDNQSMCIAHLH